MLFVFGEFVLVGVQFFFIWSGKIWIEGELRVFKNDSHFEIPACVFTAMKFWFFSRYAYDISFFYCLL